MTRRSPCVVFVAAAGPRLGYGHLLRCGALADALGVRRQLVLHGSTATLHRAIALGWVVHRGPDLLAWLAPDLVVVDDPSVARVSRWVRRARTLELPVATIRDGRSGAAPGDLVIDGSFVTAPRRDSRRLTGVGAAILRPEITRLRSKAPARRANRVVIALGGGGHVQRLGVELARAVAHRLPHASVEVAAGFTAGPRSAALPPRCHWAPPASLARLLATAAVAVVGGGVTMYEACALAAPAVAWPVVAAQRPAVRAAAAAGAVHDASGRWRQASPAQVAEAVARLLADPPAAASLGRQAGRLVDGGGAWRVAIRLRALIDRSREGRWRHAA